jgi:hypothetical protein
MLLRNDGAKDVDAKLEVTLLDRRGRPLASLTREALLRPHRATAVDLTISPDKAFDKWRDDRLPARGVVVLTAKESKTTGMHANPKTRDLQILQVQPSSAETFITLVGLGAAIALALYGLAISGRSTATPDDSTPKWSAQSWSTNLAIGGALFTAVLGIAALPAQTHYAARSTYSTFSLLFAALVTLAPAIYGLLNVGGPHTPARALRLFALAAAVTVWATIGQLGLSALLFLELGLTFVISPAAAYAAAGLAGLVAAIVFVYALRAVHSFTVPPAAELGQPPVLPMAGRPWSLI